MKRIWCVFLLAIAAAILNLACTSKSEGAKAAAAPPAKIDNRVKESELTKVTLTPEAASRLGIELASVVESQLVTQTSVAGEVAAIPGRALIVNAPVTGTVSLVRASLTAGEAVRKGEAVYRLIPMAGVQRDLRVTVEADVKATKARLDTASQQLARAQQLLRDMAGSQRQVETAEQEFGLAKAAHDAAAERLQQINIRPLDSDVQMTVTAPADGIVRQVLVAAGQAVSSGAALFEVVDYSRVWLRVPVYAGDANAFASQREARVQAVDGAGPTRIATRVAAPPTADPLAVTTDLYFELSNIDGQLRPGQRLMVHLPTRSKPRSSLMVPVAAILYDVQGGAWVYVNESGHVYRRQRVELIETQGSYAYLARGLTPGTRVVTAGAAELFGTEFGAGKMRTLVKTALDLRWVVAALSILLLIVGFRVIPTTPMDVFPEFSPLLVEIQTEAPGLSTAEVEALISTPIENALNGVKGMKIMRSKSVLGLSSVVLIFEESVELMSARQLVQERLLTLTGRLPVLARTPVVLSPLSSTSRVLKIGVWSNKLTQTEMTTLIRWSVRPRLMSIPGVANVAIWGQRDRQLQVLVDPDRMRDYRLTLADIVRVTQDATMPAAGGFVETPNQRLSVTHMAAIRTPADLREVPVAFRNGAPLTLGRVANVVEGHQPPIGDAVINDQPGLLLIVEKQLGANTLQVTRDVEKAITQLRPGLKNVELDTTIFRPATFIEMSLENLKDALIWGCVLVAIILILFLFEWRTALISLTAIPLSLVTAALVLYWRGATLNTMVIAGLAIALGEVVDDAIIDVENVLRRLRQNESAGHPLPAWSVVLEASLEVRSAVVYATIIVVLVFIPVFFLEGLAGAFFRPLALSYVLAVTASLGVALIVTPALCLMLLPRASRKAEHRETRFVSHLKRLYRRMLPPLLVRPRLLVAALALIFVVTGISVTQLGEEFLPHFQEYDFLMHWVEKPGTSLQAMQRITARASRELRAVPGVRNFGSHIGRAEVADEVVGPNFTELWISLDPNVDYAPTVARIQAIVDGYPGLYRDLLTYLKERIKEVLSGGGGAIVVRLFGPNLEILRAKADEIGKVMSSVDGTTNVQVEPQVEVPQVEVRIKAEAAQRFGLTPGDIRRAAMTFIRGTKAGEIYEDQKIFDVTVWSDEKWRTDLSNLIRILIDAPLGGKVPLGDVAELRIAPTPNVIQHENASRRIDVSCNAKGRDLGSVARDIEQKLRSVEFAPGYHPEILGEYAARQASQQRLLALSALSLMGILLVLFTDFRSVRLTALVFISLPFALVGGVASAFLTGDVLSLGSLVGFVTVLGIAARNGVMLVSHYRHLEEQEGAEFGREMILRGSEERLVPILMTAAATALALLPIALGGNKPGHEIEHPMAVVILGGLFTSTLLNLFVMPALSLRFARSMQGRSE